MLEPCDKAYEAWALDDEAHFEETVTPQMVAAFAELSGDTNPLHTQESFAKKHGHPAAVAHGMIGGALFSRLVGMHLPGLRALYLSQSINFKKPIYAGTEVVVLGRVIQKVDALRVLKLKTSIADKTSGELYIDGEAMVKVLD